MVKQAELDSKYAAIEAANGFPWPTLPVDLDDRKSQAFIKELNQRLVTELFECMECLKNKAWKETHMPTDKDHFFEELSDALHFFLELINAVGLTPDQLYRLYWAKHQVNRFRQESHY